MHSTAALFIFSVLFFGIMTDVGMFDRIINALMKRVGHNVVGVALMTCKMCIRDRHEAYPHIHVLSFGKERVCWDFIAAFRKDFQLQEAARFLVDSMKEL